MSETYYRCKACETENTMVERFCSSCGAENELWTKKIEKLQARRNKTENKRASFGVHDLEKKPDLHSEIWEGVLTRHARKLRIEETRLKTGNTHQGKLQWIKEQLYCFKRPIQEIADDLGETMIRVAKYVDEIDKQDLM